MLSFNYTYKTKDITKNYHIQEASVLIEKYLTETFFNADLFSNTETSQLFGNTKGNFGLKISKNKSPLNPTLNHDKKKNYAVQQTRPFLFELGVTNSKCEIRPGMHDKFRQINKYIEIVASLISEISAADSVKIVDMGSGKAYLTFALYDYLTQNTSINPTISGIEFRSDLVNFCNDTSKKCGFERLHFTQGSIADIELPETNVLIALHACDTATDDALAKGIKAGAELIVVAPCCHKQLRKQFNVQSELISILKHGILQERQAELLTDGIRALILEAFGYKTKVFEFISTEHTPKNVMIVAQKTSHKTDKEGILQKIRAVKKMFGIEFHYLEKLMNI